jgi:uncharacterized protein (TIGR03086 family)
MLEDLRAATEWAALLFDGVDIDHQADRPTPCTEWNVRALMNHVIAWNRLFAAGLLKVRPPDEITAAALATTPGSAEPVPDLVHGAPGHAYRTSSHELLAVVSLDPQLQGTCELPIGELPATTVFSMALLDNIVHGWDLATATDQDATIPELLLAMLEPAVASLPIDRTRGTAFAPVRPAPEGASRQQRVLAYLGRRA